VAADLVDRLLAGDSRALARAISLVENGSPQVAEILRRVYPRTGAAYVVGVTGSPGAGKSSLVSVMASAYRQRGERVGVIAVDPSSAFSGGAILGDRIRMQRHFMDPQVFIRSMANRGHPGGLSKATHDAVDLMDAAGYTLILLETVGVGQDEIEVVEGADTVCVVLVPGAGDDIQSIKAGIMEIAHIFVINKADRPGADRVQTDVEQSLSLDEWNERWRPRLVPTVATTAVGIDALLLLIDEHRSTTAGGDAVSRRRRDLSRTRFLDLLRERLLHEVAGRVGPQRLEEAIAAIAERRTDPYTATDELLAAAGLAEAR
jgi:LAO/AO transport system kinase